MANAPVSLDHYLDDEDVVEVMESNCTLLSPTFALDHPEEASIYFNPLRNIYPVEAHRYGWVDKVART
jgi:hypothetical protein